MIPFIFFHTPIPTPIPSVSRRRRNEYRRVDDEVELRRSEETSDEVEDGTGDYVDAGELDVTETKEMKGIG